MTSSDFLYTQDRVSLSYLIIGCQNLSITALVIAGCAFAYKSLDSIGKYFGSSITPRRQKRRQKRRTVVDDDSSGDSFEIRALRLFIGLFRNGGPGDLFLKTCACIAFTWFIYERHAVLVTQRISFQEQMLKYPNITLSYI